MKKKTLECFRREFIFFRVEKTDVIESDAWLLNQMLIEIKMNNQKARANFTINKFEYDDEKLVMEGENIPYFAMRIFKKYSFLFSKVPVILKPKKNFFKTN